MKETIIIIAVLVLTFVPNFIFKNYLETSGSEIIDLVEVMKNELKNENSENDYSKELENTFLDKEKKWIMFVDHEILDEIENSIEECIAFYNAKDYMEFESSSNKLKSSIEDLRKREEISLSNIL